MKKDYLPLYRHNINDHLDYQLVLQKLCSISSEFPAFGQLRTVDRAMGTASSSTAYLPRRWASWNIFHGGTFYHPRFHLIGPAHIHLVTEIVTCFQWRVHPVECTASYTGAFDLSRLQKLFVENVEYGEKTNWFAWYRSNTKQKCRFHQTLALLPFTELQGWCSGCKVQTHFIQ